MSFSGLSKSLITFSLFTCSLCLGFTPDDNASTPTAKEKLQQLIQSEKELEQQLTQANNAANTSSSVNSSAQKKLSLAKRALQAAIANQVSNPNDQSQQAKVKNARFKLALAERKYDRAQEEIRTSATTMLAIEETLNTIRPQIIKLQAAITETNPPLNTTTAITAIKQPAPKTNKESLIEEKIGEKKTALLNPKIKTTENNVKQQKSNIHTAKIAEKNTRSLKQASIKPKPKKATVKKNYSAPRALLLTSPETIKAEQERFSAKVASTSQKEKKVYNRILNVKPISSAGSNKQTKAFTLRSLGNDQFRGTAELIPGDNIFIIGFNRWRQTIPKSETGNRYTILFDTSNNKHPKLVYFNESIVSP